MTIQIIKPIDELVHNLTVQKGYKLDAYTYDYEIAQGKLIVNVHPIEGKK